MKIGSTITALFNPSRSDAADLLRQLRSGQVLQANVIDSPRPGIARLQIGLIELLAKTQSPLARGAPLTLRVVRLGSMPELQVLPGSWPVNLEQHLLRKALPQQMSMGEALNAIGRAVRDDARMLPGALIEDAHRLLNRVISPAALSAAQVKELFLNSGLFFEALLARHGRPGKGDTKLELLRLLRGLETWQASNQATKPAVDSLAQATAQADVPLAGGTEDSPLERLRQLLNGALARINTHQVASLAHDPPERCAWQFDLPLLCRGQFEDILLRVAREPQANAQPGGQHEGTRWTATLRFDFASTGWIQADLLVQQNRISSTFWCERASTERRIGAQLPRLEQAMISAGLQVDTLAARHASPPNQPGLPRPGQALIDDHA